MNPVNPKRHDLTMNNPFCYFDVVFYIQKENNSLSSFIFPEASFAPDTPEYNTNVKRLTIMTNQKGKMDYQKAREIIFNKSKREGFQKVLVISHFLENHLDSFQEHLSFLVENMRTRNWYYWRIETLSETVLTSAFKEKYPTKNKTCFAYAFKLPQQ